MRPSTKREHEMLKECVLFSANLVEVYGEDFLFVYKECTERLERSYQTQHNNATLKDQALEIARRHREIKGSKRSGKASRVSFPNYGRDHTSPSQVNAPSIPSAIAAALPDRSNGPETRA